MFLSDSVQSNRVEKGAGLRKRWWWGGSSGARPPGAQSAQTHRWETTERGERKARRDDRGRANGPGLRQLRPGQRINGQEKAGEAGRRVHEPGGVGAAGGRGARRAKGGRSRPGRAPPRPRPSPELPAAPRPRPARPYARPEAPAPATPLTRDQQAQVEMSALPEGGTCRRRANGPREKGPHTRACAADDTRRTRGAGLRSTGRGRSRAEPPAPPAQGRCRPATRTSNPGSKKGRPYHRLPTAGAAVPTPPS